MKQIKPEECHWKSSSESIELKRVLSSTLKTSFQKANSSVFYRGLFLHNPHEPDLINFLFTRPLCII